MSEFKRASDMEREEPDELLGYVPQSRQERVASLLATINGHPEGLNLQHLIATVSHKWGLRRETIIDYLQSMERSGRVQIKWFKVYPRKRKKRGPKDT